MKQYIEYTLGNENYATEMNYVREIIKPVKIMNLIGVPDYVKGVAKVREQVIVIIDLRQKFKLDLATCDNGEPRIVILENGSDIMGLWVDDIVEIIESDNVEKIPGMIQLGIVSEIIKLEDRVIPVLDAGSLFSKDLALWMNTDEDAIQC